MILYEYPLNERIRSLLRLEDLFDRFDFFAQRDHPFEHHAAITTLFDILEVSGRADLKSDLLQELERQRQTLAQFRGSPGVALDALERILAEIDRTRGALSAMTGRTGQHLRENDWLMSIRSRATIAGGACEFDLPSYHAWQHRPPDARREEIAAWAAPFRPLQQSLSIVLRLLRESAQRQRMTAQAGNGFQQPMGGKTFQMVQIRLDPACTAIPEVSANKHLLWIRFMTQDGEHRPRPADRPVDFELGLCNL